MPDFLRQVPAFANLTEEVRVAVAAKLHRRDLLPGESAVEVGDAGRWLGIVVSGELDVVTAAEDGGPGVVTAALGPTATFGGWTLLGGGVRSASVRARSASTIAELSLASFNELAGLYPSVREALFNDAVGQVHLRDFERAIRTAWKINDPLVIRALMEMAVVRSVATGEILVTAGTPAASAFVIITGGLRVEATEQMGTLGPGQLVGERALLESGVRAATLIAIRPTSVAEFGAEALARICEQYPSVVLATARQIMQRNDTTVTTRIPAARRVAVIGDGVIDPDHIARQLQVHFPFPTRIITADIAEQMIGLNDSCSDSVAELNATRVGGWLDQEADQSTWQVLVADPKSRRWLTACLSHADHIVAVASAGGTPPTRHAVWEPGRQPMQPTTLVLVHPGSTKLPAGTAKILSRLPADNHLHMRTDNVSDHGRVARTLAGVPYGLVLSGGGARGFAHLGATRSMRELGIPCDLVGGTSIGAVMGLNQCMDLSTEEQLAQTEAGFKGLFDYTLPVVSLLKGQRTSERIQNFVGDHTVEDLWIPYFCVSTNLSTNNIKVHRSGPLATAIRASLALPGIFPPVHDGEHFLVDGGVLNNFPLDVMRAINPDGTVIAVDVAADMLLEATGNFGLQLSGWRAAAAVVKRKPLAPSIASTLMRTSVIGSARDRDRYLRLRYADVHLELALQGCSLMDFEAVRQVAQFGYTAAHPRLKAWWDGKQMLDSPTG
jgi:predicted acylesterase/phospholipase RssA/CRP-like cAMP-binding protein